MAAWFSRQVRCRPHASWLVSLTTNTAEVTVTLRLRCGFLSRSGGASRWDSSGGGPCDEQLRPPDRSHLRSSCPLSLVPKFPRHCDGWGPTGVTCPAAPASRGDQHLDPEPDIAPCHSSQLLPGPGGLLALSWASPEAGWAGRLPTGILGSLPFLEARETVLSGPCAVRRVGSLD